MLLCVLLITCSAANASSNRHPRLIVVVVNRLLLSDIDHPYLPTLSMMLRQGAVGLISPNCSGWKTETSVMLTANAGSPARGGACVKQFFDYGERTPDGMLAQDAYAVRTGRRAPKGSAVFLGLGQALRENEKLNTVPAKIGALGDALHAAGLKTGIVGNADRISWTKDDEPLDRSAAALAMDSRGIVDCGSIGGLLLYSMESQPGMEDDPPFEPQNNVDKADVIVIDLSLSSLDESRMSMTDAAFQAESSKCAAGIEILLEDLVRREPTGTTIVLVSFSPPKGPAWDQLTPMVVYPPPSGKTGLLTSASTRTPGLIGATDFAPTVLQLMNVDVPDDMLGRAAVVVPGRGAVEILQRMSDRATTNRRMLLPMGVAMAVIAVLSFTGAAVTVAFGLKPSRRMLGLMKTGLVASGCLAPALYLVSLGPARIAGYLGTTLIALIALTTASVALGGVISRRTGMRAAPIVVAFGIAALMILIDAVTGANLCRWAGFCSFQISGMRFYGIGNEYAAVLISAAAMVALWLVRRSGEWRVESGEKGAEKQRSIEAEGGNRKAESGKQRSREAEEQRAESGKQSRALVIVLGVVVVIALGVGSFGANYGGTATAVVTFGLLWMVMSRGGFSARHVAGMVALAIAAVAAFALIDWQIAGAAGSHAAGATDLAGKLGGGYVGSLVMRKALFNLKLTFSVKGIGPMIAFVPFLALWFWGIQGKVRTLFKADGRVLAGAKAVIIGAVLAYLVNDSGIVFAPVMIAMMVLALLYSVLDELKAESGKRTAVDDSPADLPEAGQCPG